MPDRLSNEQQIQEFLNWLRHQKRYTIAHQFDMEDPGTVNRGMMSEQGILYMNRALKEVQATDQQIIADFFQGLPIPAPPVWVPPPKKPWWHQVIKESLGCTVTLVVLGIIISMAMAFCSQFTH
jgi:hypothetical protein